MVCRHRTVFIYCLKEQRTPSYWLAHTNKQQLIWPIPRLRSLCLARRTAVYSFLLSSSFTPLLPRTCALSPSNDSAAVWQRNNCRQCCHAYHNIVFYWRWIKTVPGNSEWTYFSFRRFRRDQALYNQKYASQLFAYI